MVYQFSSVTQSSLTLLNPMDCSTAALPVHHQLLEFTETHVHRVGDAIQPSHPLSSPSPPVFNLISILLLLLLNCFSHVRYSVRPRRRQPTQAPSSLGFSRQEHWSGLPFPSPMHESEK